MSNVAILFRHSIDIRQELISVHEQKITVSILAGFIFKKLHKLNIFADADYQIILNDFFILSTDPNAGWGEMKFLLKELSVWSKKKKIPLLMVQSDTLTSDYT